MAETVQAYLEGMVPELEDLERRKIFTSVCYEKQLQIFVPDMLHIGGS
jgi:hypothetical protein